MHKVLCLELDTFQVLRGQGQISDINKDGHMALGGFCFSFVFLRASKGVNLYLEVSPTKYLCMKEMLAVLKARQTET